MRLIPLLAVLVASGCARVGFELADDSTCPAAFDGWSGTLTHHLLAGDGDGSFAFDPPEAIATSTTGAYDLATGDFAWNTQFVAGHWRRQQSISGFGYANPNGDLDIEYRDLVQDALGGFLESQVRYLRAGCQVTEIRTTPDDLQGDRISRSSGRYDGDTFRWTGTDDVRGDVWQVEGTRQKSLTASIRRVLDVEDREAEYLAEVDESAGTSLTDFSDVRQYGRQTVTIEGTDERFVDGSLHRTYDYRGGTNRFSVDFTQDYSGDGSGELTYSGGRCPIEVKDGVCIADCGSGNRFEC